MQVLGGLTCSTCLAVNMPCLFSRTCLVSQSDFCNLYSVIHTEFYRLRPSNEPLLRTPIGCYGHMTVYDLLISHC